MKRIVFVGFLVLLCRTLLLAQSNDIEPGYQTTPTVIGGTSTGLFSTLGTRTLKRGEFTIGAFWNNIDRDPGDLDINQIPLNFTIGVTDRWEIFANIDVFQQVTTRQPFALSGTQFNGIRSMFGGDPVTAFGRPVGSPRSDEAGAFFPFSGSLAGGVLPPPGFFFGPEYVANRPSFYNELPFFGPAVFIREGQFDVRRSANGIGNVTVGTKVALNNPDSRFTIALAGIVKIPTVRNYHGLANGRGTGEVDFGPIVVLGQSSGGHRLRFTENIGYIRSGNPEKSDLQLLDRRDQLMLNAGVEAAVHQKLVLVGELNGTVYVGSGTPNLNPVNPVDLVAGFRYFASRGRFQIGAGYRRFLNNSNEAGIAGFRPGATGLSLFSTGSGDVNGFVVSLGFGRRIEREPPTPPNRPPTVFLEADRTTVQIGETVNLTARASDPDNDVLDLTWSSTSGQIIGTGSSVQLDTTGLSQSDVTVKVTADDKKAGTASDSKTIHVTEAPAPPPPPPPSNRPPSIQSVNCQQVVGTALVNGQVTDGETVRVRATASDPDGDRLTYQWNASAGRIRGSGPEVTLDTTGVTGGPGSSPVSITITLTVSDARGETDTANCALTVHSGAKPEIEKVQMDLTFPQGGARVDNEHKALLDDVALRLQQDPGTRLVIYGHTDKGEPVSLAQRRADNTKSYLVHEKGIDPSRIIVRSLGANQPHSSGERDRNRRVELLIVPSGAEIPEP